MSTGIGVEHPLTHIYTQNGLAQSLIKHYSNRALWVRQKIQVISSQQDDMLLAIMHYFLIERMTCLGH